MMKGRKSIIIPREVLLVEIERRCFDPLCNAKTRVGITKEEARLYRGFECERCERWNDDVLTERDVPEWWEELIITDLHTVREQRRCRQDVDEPGEVISRMSDSYRRGKDYDEAGGDDTL